MEYLSFYLLYEPNYVLCVFTNDPKLQFHISDLMGKIVQNINFSSVSQNSDLSSNLNPTPQYKARGTLYF